MKLKERIDSLCDRVALELKKSKQSAATADDLNHWKERANLYVQSRGHGLVTNGSGLMRDNTNFSRFAFDPSDSYAGFGMFTSDVRNADLSIDEYIPINRGKRYRFGFYAKTLNQEPNNKAYFYISCHDIDGKTIYNHSNAATSFRTDSEISNATKSLVVIQEDREKFGAWFAKTNGSFVFLNGSYASDGGFKFPDGTYSQENYTHSSLAKSRLKYEDGVLSGLAFNRVNGIKTGRNIVNLGIASGTYIYPMRAENNASNFMADHAVPDVWTEYTVEVDIDKIARPNTNMIKIGWLLNRGSSGMSKTAISNVDVREI